MYLYLAQKCPTSALILHVYNGCSNEIRRRVVLNSDRTLSSVVINPHIKECQCVSTSH